ncbi:ZZ-type zinc finger-containing protein 3 [Rhizophlyctis rosea]|nr:ZZ-type zinc finger-containing protein 3 [Rhizophlyctis rosea]
MNGVDSPAAQLTEVVPSPSGAPPLAGAEEYTFPPKEAVESPATPLKAVAYDGAPEQAVQGEYAVEADLLEKNEDYQLLCNALNVLRAQLQQGEADLQRLTNMREQALENPNEFIESLLARRNEAIPVRQQVIRIPDIDGLPPLRPRRTGERWLCVMLARLPPDPYHLMFQVPMDQPIFNGSDEGISRNTSIPMAIDGANEDSAGGDELANNGAPWTDEEQAKLVDLLELFPEEPVHQRRLEKIAAAMGTRTARQVGRRVQKLFEQLRAAGKPLPGRSITNEHASSTPKTGNVGRIAGAYYTKFGNSRSISGAKVVMSDDEDSGSDDGIPAELKDSEEYKELVRLRNMAKKRAGPIVPAGHESEAVHHGFSCDACGSEPIVGIRWKCMDCPEETQVDLCDECHESGFSNAYHIPSHQLQRIEIPEEPFDGELGPDTGKSEV